MKRRKRQGDVERERDKSIFDVVNLKSGRGRMKKSIYTSSGKKI
jgi:hypothetical protein